MISPRVVGHTPNGLPILQLANPPTGRSVGNAIDDAARELADEGAQFFEGKVREMVPKILDDNKEMLQEVASNAVRDGVASANLGPAIDQATDKMRRGMLITAGMSAVIGAVLSFVLVKNFG